MTLGAVEPASTIVRLEAGREICSMVLLLRLVRLERVCFVSIEVIEEEYHISVQLSLVVDVDDVPLIRETRRL